MPIQIQTRDELIEKTKDGELPGAAALEIDYRLKVEALRKKYPNIEIIPHLSLVPEYLKQYNTPLKDLTDVLPCGEDWLERNFKKDLHFILLTKSIKDEFKECFVHMTPRARRAYHFYSIKEIAELIRSRLESTIGSVSIPISLFVKDIEGFQKEFKDEKLMFKTMLANSNKGRLAIPKVSDWSSVRNHVSPEICEILGSWKTDIKAKRIEQGIGERQEPKLKRLSVELPSNVLPVCYRLSDISERIQCATRSTGARYVISNGWVRHQIIGTGLVGFTPGPLLGKAENWEDYAIGATATVTVERALSLIKEEEISKAKHWNLTSDDIYWQKGRFTADRYQLKHPMPTSRVPVNNDWS